MKVRSIRLTLLLSGIGAVDDLKKHELPVVQENNAAGQNLKDHLCTTAVLCKAKSGTALDYLSSNINAFPALFQWLIMGSGPLTSNAGEAAAFILTAEHHIHGSPGNPPKDNTSGGIEPDVKIIGALMAYIHHGEESAIDGNSIFSIIPIGLRPQSKGTITLRSSDVFDSREFLENV